MAAMAIQPDQAMLNRQLKPHLKDIIKCKVKMNEDDAKRNLDLMQQTIDRLLDAMKNMDPLFKELYQTRVYSGSYYHGVRVKDATEFDLIIVLRLPFKGNDVTINRFGDAPAYVSYKLNRSVETILSVNNPKWTPALYQKFITCRWFDNGRLTKSSVRSWIVGLITNALDCITLPKGVRQLNRSSSGPAFTLLLVLNNGVRVDVDFVPVIDGSIYSIPGGIHRSNRFNQLKPEAQHWYLVPKPRINGEIRETYWRMAFPLAEKELLKIQGCLKSLVKLFKLLRDTEGWTKITSYHIKTMFMLEMDERADWREDELGTLFMMMLIKFRNYLNNRALPYYFQRSENLLGEIPRHTSDPIVNRLDKIIADISKDGNNVVKYF